MFKPVVIYGRVPKSSDVFDGCSFFCNHEDARPASVLRNGAKEVFAYVNAGGLDLSNRVEARWAKAHSNRIGNAMKSWPKERFLDVRYKEVATRHWELLEDLKLWGFTGVDFDNLMLDTSAIMVGFRITPTEMADFIARLVAKCRSLGLLVSLRHVSEKVLKLLTRRNCLPDVWLTESLTSDELKGYVQTNVRVCNINYSEKTPPAVTGVAQIRADVNLTTNYK